jgi:hypothetical protein
VKRKSLRPVGWRDWMMDEEIPQVVWDDPKERRAYLSQMVREYLHHSMSEYAWLPPVFLNWRTPVLRIAARQQESPMQLIDLDGNVTGKAFLE